MKKIVFNCMLLQPMQKPIYTAQQKDINQGSTYENPIYFPVNAVLANDLKPEDDLKIVTIKFLDEINPDNKKNFDYNYDLFKKEIFAINNNIHANITLEILETEFKESKDIFASTYFGLYEKLEKDAVIFTDITFGPKTATIIILNLLSFAEKFYNADIKSIIYGKTSFIRNSETEKLEPSTGTVKDITALFYLNGLSNEMNANSPEEALKVLKLFFGKE